MKIRNLLRGSLLLAVVFLANDLLAQLSFTGEFRPRSEYRKGYKMLSDVNSEAAFFTSQRTRLNLKYKGDNFKVGLTIQDVRTWGDVKQLNKTDDHLFLHEAWAQYFFTKEFSIKLGRQELAYDDQRILGSVNWAQQGRSHDVAVFKVKSNSFKMDFGLAFNQVGEPTFGTYYDLANYKAFQYIWLHNDFDKLGASILLLNNGIQNPNKVVYSQTYGLRLTYKLDKLFFAVAYYGQGGKNGNNVDLSASYFAGEATYKLSKQVSFGLGYEQLSGNDMGGNTNEDKAFTPLYGTNHKFNGHMDYFYVGNHVGSVGLKDLYTKFNYKEGKFSATLALHFFSADGKVMNGTTMMDSKLGTEFDFYMGYKLNKSVSVNAGLSKMFATESMEVVKGVGDSDEGNTWGWVMFVFKPNFL